MSEYKEIARIGEEIRSLFAHPGWKHVLRFFEIKEEEAFRGLVNAKDLEEVVRYQAVVRVINELKVELDALIQQGEIAEKLMRGELHA